MFQAQSPKQHGHPGRRGAAWPPSQTGELRQPAQEGAGLGSQPGAEPGGGVGWRTAETPSRTGTFSTQSDRLDGTLGGTVSASLKGERPGWLSPAGVRPASSPWTTPGWAL